MSKRIPSRWKVSDPYSAAKGLLRMSWNRMNLYNLHNSKKAADLSRRSVFQQKWTAKRQLRAYHVPNITESQLLARHWKSQLPLAQMTMKQTETQPPVQALAFAELERRLDVVVFRSHFASSIFQARNVVVQGHVTVNGEKCPYPARRLNPGDLVSIDPKVVVTLIPRKNLKSAELETDIDAEPQTVAAPSTQEIQAAKREAAKKVEKDGKESESKPIAVEKEGKEGPGNEESKADNATVVETSNSGPTEKIETAAKEEANRDAPSSGAAQKKLSQLEQLVKKHPKSLPFFPLPYMAPWMFIPNYLEVCYNTCSTVFLRQPMPQPTSVEIPSPHAPDMHALAYEWYSSIKRSKTKRPPQAEPLVVNGRSVRLKSKFDSIVRARLKQERDDKWAVWAKRDEEARVHALEQKNAKVSKQNISV